MKKKYRAFLDQFEKDFGYRPNHIEIAKVLVENNVMHDVKKGANALGNRLFNDRFLSCEEYDALRGHYYNGGGDILKGELLKDVWAVPYWEGCESCRQDLKHPFILRPVIVDREINQKILRRNPDNFRAVTMPDHRMEGEPNRFSQGDLLCIDISDTNYSNGGKYFYISKGKNSKENKYIAAVAEMSIDFDGNTVFKFSNPTDPSKPLKRFTSSELEERQFKVIGRVIFDWFKTE